MATNDQLSLLMIGTPWRPVLPIAGTGITEEDQYHLLGLYRGFGDAGVPTTPGPTTQPPTTQSPIDDVNTSMLVYITGMRQDELEGFGETVLMDVGANRQSAIITVGTSEQSIAIGSSIGMAGYLFCSNHTDPRTSPNNYVSVGYVSGVYRHQVYAGESVVIPLAIDAVNIYVVATASGTKFEYEISERAL